MYATKLTAGNGCVAQPVAYYSLYTKKKKKYMEYFTKTLFKDYKSLQSFANKYRLHFRNRSRKCNPTLTYVHLFFVLSGNKTIKSNKHNRKHF